MSNKPELTIEDISLANKIAFIEIFVRSNLSKESTGVFYSYINNNTGELDSELQQWTTSEAALGAAIVNEMTNAALTEYVDRHSTPPIPQDVHIHDKVYANQFLASNPPQYQWICRNCGEQGTTRTDPGEGSTEYDVLVNRHYNKNKEK